MLTNRLLEVPNRVVDASELIRRGSFGLDLTNPLVDYTLGWLDPIAAHSDFTNPEAIALAAWMASGGRTRLSRASEAPALRDDERGDPDDEQKQSYVSESDPHTGSRLGLQTP